MNEANLDVELNRPYLPAIDSPQQVISQLNIEPGLQTSDVERHIAIAVDTSGSMSGNKMKRLQQETKYVFDYLQTNDILTIIGFASSASIILEATRFGDVGRDTVIQKINHIDAGGNTDIYNGLECAAKQLRELPAAENTARRILLLPDGKDNKRGPEDFARQARDIDNQGIRIRAGGLGDDYEEETIRTLGTEARGQWSHIEEGPEISQFFGETIQEANTVVGSDAELRLDIADWVEFTEAYRAVPQTQEVDVEYARSNKAVIKLPDLREQETQQVLTKIQVPGSKDTGACTLATLTLSTGDRIAGDRVAVEFTCDNQKLAVENKNVRVS